MADLPTAPCSLADIWSLNNRLNLRLLDALTQTGSAPPTFAAFTNRSGKLHFSVERYLENRIREQFAFFGTPIVIKSRASR